MPMSDKHFLKLLGQAIKDARAKQGLSQSAMANDIGMEKSNLSVIENGKSNPQILTVVRICSALEISLDQLIDFDFDYVGFKESREEYIPRKHVRSKKQ